MSFTANERLQIVEKYKDTDKYFRRFIGGAISMRGFERWCLWVNEAEYKELKEIPELKKDLTLLSNFDYPVTERPQLRWQKNHIGL